MTNAYKMKLQEIRKLEQEERLRNAKEDADDVTKKKDILGFYFNLKKNIAFGGSESGEKHPEPKPQVPNEVKKMNLHLQAILLMI